MNELIRLEALSFAYPKGDLILSDLDESIRAGEIVAITGPSGRGKSTLLYLIGLLLRPISGTVWCLGRDTGSLTDRQRSSLRASTFGFVFQDAALDPTRTVLDNIMETALYRDESLKDARARAHTLMEEFGVDLRADHRPGQISGGQAQRVALCRALLGNPPLLLADEPTGNLDAASATVVHRALRDVAERGGAAVVSTHDRDLIEVCTRRVEL